MNEQARKLWKTPQGASVLRKWAKGQLLDPQEQQQVQKLKQADPPNLKGKTGPR